MADRLRTRECCVGRPEKRGRIRRHALVHRDPAREPTSDTRSARLFAETGTRLQYKEAANVKVTPEGKVKVWTLFQYCRCRGGSFRSDG